MRTKLAVAHRGRVHFRNRDRRKVRSLDLKDVDFSCSTPVRVLDLDAEAEGDVARRLVPYSREINPESAVCRR